MGRYGGRNCGKCGGSHRGVCPAYYDEGEAAQEEESNRTVNKIVSFIRMQAPSVFSHERYEELRQAVIDARNDMIEDENHYPELMDYLLYFVRKGTPVANPTVD